LGFFCCLLGLLLSATGGNHQTGNHQDQKQSKFFTEQHSFSPPQ
jgi:hypothetical protein